MQVKRIQPIWKSAGNTVYCLEPSKIFTSYLKSQFYSGDFCVFCENSTATGLVMNAGRETLCRNAGCSELCIMHLLDPFAFIAVQHNSGTTLAPRVSTLHYPPCLRTRAAERTQMERNGESANRLSHKCTRTHSCAHREAPTLPLASPLLVVPYS